jgi:hypothetical protein
MDRNVGFARRESSCLSTQSCKQILIPRITVLKMPLMEIYAGVLAIGQFWMEQKVWDVLEIALLVKSLIATILVTWKISQRN